MSRRLEVFLHDESIGELSEIPEGTEFRFFDSYLGRVPRSVLGQKFEDDLFRAHRSRKGEGLPDFFSNLIPEGRLRELIEEIAGLDPGDDLALLAQVGGDLPGAVEVRPFAGEELASEDPRGPRDAPVEGEEAEEALRFSLAGVQLKLSMLREKEKLTLPIRDQAGDWIAKFASPTFEHLPENEFSMLEWARAAGFDVPECHLHDVGDLDTEVGLLRAVSRLVDPKSRVLAIRRYDRTGDGPVHQEDFAQAVGLPAAKKYEQIKYETMAVLVRRFVGDGAVDEFVRRLVLVLGLANGDAHLKNWSLIYPDRIRPELSSVYDQVATVAWRLPARELALKLAGAKAFGRIDRAAFERFGVRAGLEERRLADLVDETLERLRQSWLDTRDELPLPPAHRLSIEHHWRTVPLLAEGGGLPSRARRRDGLRPAD